MMSTGLIRILNGKRPKYSPAAIFEPLDHEAWATLLPLLNEHEYADGEMIVGRGETSSNFHIILSGAVELILEEELDISFPRLGRGRYIGEMSCLTGEPVQPHSRRMGKCAPCRCIGQEC